MVVKLLAHTDPTGRLIIDLPPPMVDVDVSVTIEDQAAVEATHDRLGWPIGFWEQFAGSMPDLLDPDDRQPEFVEPI